LVSAIDYLALVQAAPDRMVSAKSSRVRSGNVTGAADSDLVPIAEGVTAFERRWSLVRQQLHQPTWPTEKPPGGIADRLARGLLDLAASPRELLYIDGSAFVVGRDRRFTTHLSPPASGPRHPGDPAWCLDLLFGVVTSVDVLRETRDDDGVHLHLAAISDLAAADRNAPYGVRPAADRGSDRERVPLQLWLTGDHVHRVSIEQESPTVERQCGRTSGLSLPIVQSKE
jgi:hypothetical protein